MLKKSKAEELKKREEEAAAAAAFEEYVATFQETGAAKNSKVWVKAGTYDAGRRHEDTKEKGKLYKPISRFPDNEKSFVLNDDKPERPKKKNEKKKSNLEIFKEELKIIQEERSERHRLKKMLGFQDAIKLPPKPGDDLRQSLSLEIEEKTGSIDDGDPNTTNIYLGNLPTKVTENYLMELFGKFGPLASVKVMWPRTEEEKSRNRLSGFVAYMCRKDGERALKNLIGKEILGAEVKLGWGKAVPLPAFPIYIPPAMVELTMPPKPSGLPFNAQVKEHFDDFETTLSNAVVKVVIPTDRTLLCLIHRVIEFVAREGPMFEAMIMNREISNPLYRFLFENQSPSHIYYRWKLFSILQGDSTSHWRLEPFKMFKNGSTWRPPNISQFTMGMPDELVPEEDRELIQGSLSNAQRSRLEKMLRCITPQRHKIAEIMIFCIEHSEAINEIIECIKESLCTKTSLQKKISRLYLISDIIYNCNAKGMNCSEYRRGFKAVLPRIFQELNYFIACDYFKEKVLAVVRAWDDWGIFGSDFLIQLQNIFLGLLNVEGFKDVSDDGEFVKKTKITTMPPKSSLELVKSLLSVDEDIDGVPLEEEKVVNNSKQVVGGFVPSKWETVDPEEVKAGAVTTTSKWDLFEDIDGVPMEEEIDEGRRNFLREVEVKCLAFGDELERRGVEGVEGKVGEYRGRLIGGKESSDDSSEQEKSSRSNKKHRRRRHDRSRSRSKERKRRSEERRRKSRSPRRHKRRH